MNIRVTGLGSWPGNDLPAALRLTFGEAPDLPYLPELPARGMGSGMIGRTGAILAGMGLELAPAGWRLAPNSGIDHSRAQGRFREDLDLLEEAAQGYAGPFKMAFAGPWTMAASIEKPRGAKALSDHGARRDLTQSLAEGIAATLAEVSRRLPDLDLRLQIDEPLMPGVLDGRIRTASGYATLRRVDVPEVSTALTTVLEETRSRMEGNVSAVLHCCAPGLDPTLVYQAGFDAFALDAAHLDHQALDGIGAAVDGGKELWLGIAPTEVPDRVLPPPQLARSAADRLRPLSLGSALIERVWLTPACGLAGWTQRPAVGVLRSLREAATMLTDDLAG